MTMAVQGNPLNNDNDRRLACGLLKVEPVLTLTGAVRHLELLSTAWEDKPPEQWRDFYEHCCTQDLGYGYAINVDSDQVMDDQIFEMLLSASPSIRAVEWTERPSIHGHSYDSVAERLKQLRYQRGIEIHLDDVGSGDDPIVKAVLTRPEAIKIDGPLFHRARDNYDARLTLSMHIDCYKKMLSEVIIEWVETLEDIQLARELGADFVQGFYFNHVRL
jgi:EAL domain-containing protein (putative c-di-GMP-specific phosphodiesterase class I)